MPNTTTALTDTEVKQAKPKSKEYSLSDGKGLAVRVKPTGTKTWIFNYQHPITKKRTNLGFGVYPDVTLARAREKRADARALLDKGIDPKQHKTDSLVAEQVAYSRTLEAVTNQWYGLKLSKVKKATADKHLEILRNHVLPVLGQKPIREITPLVMQRVLRPIEARGALETVKRLCRTVNEIMTLALNSGYIDANPLTHIAKVFITPAPKHMATIKPERLPELMQSLASANLMLTTRCLVEWQLHTMTRPSETAMATWDEIDRDKKIWIIPAERMKRGIEHVIPLTEQTLALLDTLESIRGNSDYLFPSHRGHGKHANVQTANMALKRIGFKGELVSHGLRALASTTLNEQGFDSELVEVCLSHVDKNRVRKAYNRSDYLERRRVLMQWWSEHIELAATGNMSVAAGARNLKVVG
ncbi:integrase domain-containing protein [Ningiella sp. W23]|uniref:integrase domain-containing protein n=1 Tax=Ningiella sp. W23 TaxID=3023715 RepID=UPI003757856B